jgi:hypothetical protein
MHQFGELTNIFWDGHLKVIAQYAVGVLNHISPYLGVRTMFARWAYY